MSTEQYLQGTDVFEITDHTTASDWERFVADIEEILGDWSLNKQSQCIEDIHELPIGHISRSLWHEKHDTIQFGHASFDIRYQYLGRDEKRLNPTHNQPNQSNRSQDYDSSKSTCSSESSKPDVNCQVQPKKPVLPESLVDLRSTNNDFASKAHCLVRWYNVRGFIVLSPKADTIVSDDKLRLLLSSASVALSDLDCHVPIFIQTHNPKSNFYQGISEHLNIRTMYEMIYQRRNPGQYAFLSEQINLFREKISASLGDTIDVTIRLNYCLQYFDLFPKKSDQFDGTEFDDQEIESDTMKPMSKPQSIAQDMRSGATYDQVVEALKVTLPHPFKILNFIHVAALWPPMSDKLITDSPVHSDLNPAEAPIWTARIVCADNCNLKIVHETQAVYNLFSDAIDYAFDKLDAVKVFSIDENRENMKTTVLRLSYQLATQPEVIISESPSDSLRKIVALLFHQAAELNAELEPLDQIAGNLKKRPSLNEMYRNFSRVTKPSVKEFIMRTDIARPFSSNSCYALPQRMFSTICGDEFRFCGAFSESTD